MLLVNPAIESTSRCALEDYIGQTHNGVRTKKHGDRFDVVDTNYMRPVSTQKL